MNEQNLEYFIADNLHELAWHHDYPINESVARWSFLRGLKDSGFKVSLKHPFKIFYVFEHNGKIYELATEITKKEISEGWKQNPPNSPRALYNSIYLVIDKLQQNIRDKYPEWKTPRDIAEAMFFDRPNKAKEARKIMEKYFLDSFTKYQEGILAPLDRDDKKIHKPRILENLIESGLIDLDRINNIVAKCRLEGRGLSSAWSTIGYLKEDEPLHENFLIWENNVEYYIWGLFILELAKLKNYPVKDLELSDKRFGKLEIAYDQGWNLLEKLRV